jgi:hypothetical protein
MVSDFILSLIRTYVPLVAGGLLTWLATTLELAIPEDASSGFVGTTVLVVSGVYYLIARWLESRWPAFSFLLGTPKSVSTPRYARTSDSSSPAPTDSSGGGTPNTG